MSIDGGTDKQDVIYTRTMEYYSATKENKVMSLEAIWMDLELVILNDVSHTEKKSIWYCLKGEAKK